MSDELSIDMDCCCASLPDLAVLPMGGDDRLDQQVFNSLQRVAKHGGDQWSLHVSVCRRCAESWMVAQDERIYDSYYLRRIPPSVRDQIVNEGRWPDEFLTYERVLALGRTMGRLWSFGLRSPALVQTIADLRRERPDISPEEIAHVLAIPVEDVIAMLPKS